MVASSKVYCVRDSCVCSDKYSTYSTSHCMIGQLRPADKQLKSVTVV